MLRTVQSLPPCRAFDTGLRPDPFPDRAASLLPGLLAATRTGLPPASDDELTTTDQPPTRSTSCLLGARENLSEDSNARTILIRYRPLAFDGPSGQPPDGRPPDARATGLRDVEGDHLGQPLAGQVHPARVADVDL